MKYIKKLNEAARGSMKNIDDPEWITDKFNDAVEFVEVDRKWVSEFAKAGFFGCKLTRNKTSLEFMYSGPEEKRFGAAIYRAQLGDDGLFRVRKYRSKIDLVNYALRLQVNCPFAAVEKSAMNAIGIDNKYNLDRIPNKLVFRGSWVKFKTPASIKRFLDAKSIADKEAALKCIDRAGFNTEGSYWQEQANQYGGADEYDEIENDTP